MFWSKEAILQFDPCAAPLDDLKIYATALGMLLDNWGHNGWVRELADDPVPVWFSTRLREVRAELAVRLRAEKDRRLRQLLAQRETLLPAEEKRAKVEAEIKQLQDELGRV